MVLHVTRVDGLTDQQIIALFQSARTEEYLELDAEATALEQVVCDRGNPEQQNDAVEVLEKLRRRFAEIARVDYFECSEGVQLAARLAAIKQLLAPVGTGAAAVAPALLAEYQDALWVTRPRPHVDRLACAWLIRRFVNPAAPIRYSCGTYFRHPLLLRYARTQLSHLAIRVMETAQNRKGYDFAGSACRTAGCIRRFRNRLVDPLMRP